MNVLVITSSAQGELSVSNRLAARFSEQVRAVDPQASIVVRDIGRDPIPHLIETTIAGVRAEAITEAETAARDLSDTLIAEVKAADVVVIASGMYNFGISSTLKAWFDHLLRPRIAFRYTETGPEGLLGPRKVVVIESRAGVYSDAPAGVDNQEPHLRQMLTFGGLDDITFIRAEGLAFGPEAAEAAIAKAEGEIDAFVRDAAPVAA